MFYHLKYLLFTFVKSKKADNKDLKSKIRGRRNYSEKNVVTVNKAEQKRVRRIEKPN